MIDSARRVFFFGVSSQSETALEFFLEREQAEKVVTSWDLDEPERAGELHIVQFESQLCPN